MQELSLFDFSESQQKKQPEAVKKPAPATAAPATVKNRSIVIRGKVSLVYGVDNKGVTAEYIKDLSPSLRIEKEASYSFEILNGNLVVEGVIRHVYSLQHWNNAPSLQRYYQQYLDMIEFY